ncbi:MAG: Xaa-Pro peptidase family protein [Pseudomonadota bacterium]
MTATARPITQQERAERVQRLRHQMSTSETDIVLLTPGSNMRYFFGLTWSETERLVAALVTSDETTFICPKFEDTALAGSLLSSYECAYWEEHENPFDLVKELGLVKGTSRVAIDPNCSFHHASQLIQAMPPGSIISATDLITPLRAVKSENELGLMQCAKNLTLSVHHKIFDWLKPGMRASEVKQEIDRLHREGGADNGSSFCAVQFGEATAHPHGIPGDPSLNKDDLILIDTGCQVEGYNSDITRTYALSKQSSRVETLWAVEKEAQAIAFDSAQIGSACETVDDTARAVLKSHGLSEDYGLPGLPHRTGHGIGLDIHEGPYLVRGDKTRLQSGMCFSNEPMIVVPDAFGIRLEDHFYMTPSGPEWFTPPQHSLYQPFA